MYDTIIIGGGPAGLTAGIYTSRERIKTLLLEKEMCGGLPATTSLVENYPGFPDGINGLELINNFKRQAERFGTEIKEYNEVKKIEKDKNVFRVITNEEEYEAYTVIVATGSVPKELGVPGEKEFRGKGVSYCATCDGPLFRDKDVAVIGCGNSGLQEGESLLRYVKSITFIEFLPYITAERILQERIKKDKKTSFLLNHKVVSIEGETFVNSVVVVNRESGEKKKINVSGIFIYVGLLPNSKFLEGVAELDSFGYIKTDEKMETSIPGIYAVGDVRSKNVRQISVACGEATIAAVSVREYLKETK